MALIYDADIHPGKMELISDWLPKTLWFPADQPGTARRVCSFRFDDPQGGVGVETHIVRAGSATIQVPLTYREAPLPGAEKFLITEMDHSVLGRRWVYDALGDPVYAQALAGALLAGEGQAEQYLEKDGGRELLPESMRISSTGFPSGGELVGAPAVEPAEWTASNMREGDWEFSVARLLDLGGRPAPDPSLTATWAGQDIPVVLAWALPRDS